MLLITKKINLINKRKFVVIILNLDVFALDDRWELQFAKLIA